MMSAQMVTRAPCGKCPFRKDVPIYLRRGRRIEIAASIAGGASFPCHEHVNYSSEDDEEHDGSAAPMCAGAAKALLAAGTTNNYLRVMSRLGAVDLDQIEQRGPDVWGLVEWQTLPEGATGDDPDPNEEDDDEEPVRTCNTVDYGCLAPAGYAMGGTVVVGTDEADSECTLCGEPVCTNCADKHGRCGMCTEEEPPE